MTRPVAVVTGASRGIGKQLSIDLAKNGYNVVVAARSSSDSPGKLPGTIDETANLVREAGGEVIVAPLDVRDEEAVARLAGQVWNEWGRCDLVVNNAAIAPTGKSLEEPTKRWRLAMDVNVHGPFYMTYYFAPRMAAEGEGRLVNISSGASQSPEFGRASYTVTKSALESMTQCHADELAGKVGVNCVRLELAVWSEGFTDTLGEGDYSMFEDPVIMSDAVLWLAEQPVSYTGNILTIGQLRELGVVRAKTSVGAKG